LENLIYSFNLDKMEKEHQEQVEEKKQYDIQTHDNNCYCMGCVIKPDVWIQIGTQLYSQLLKESSKSNGIIEHNEKSVKTIQLRFIGKYNIIGLGKIIENCLKQLDLDYNIVYKNNECVEFVLVSESKIIIKQYNGVNQVDTYIDELKIDYTENFEIINNFIKKFRNNFISYG